MSRVLSGTGQYLTTSGAVLTAAPLTMACWGIHGATGVLDYAMNLGVSGATNNRFVLGVNASDQVFMESAAASASSAVTTATVPTSGWQHFAGVTASATSRFAYLNGTPGSVQTTSRVPSGINMLRVGAGGTASSLWTGTIAHCAVWNVALTDAEIAALAAGLSPLAMRPGALVAYWPYMGRDTADIDIVGRFDLTNTSTTSGADEPRLLWMPTRRIFIPAAAGGATQSGSGAATLPLVTASGSASRALKSTGAVTLPLATATGAGKRDLKSTGTASLPLLDASGAGKKERAGTGSPSLPLIAAVGVALRGLKSTGAADLPLILASGSGSITVPGSASGDGAVTLPLLTATGVGTKERKGTGTPSLPLLSADGVGSRALKATGTPSLPLLTAEGVGGALVVHEGEGAATIPLLSATGAGPRRTEEQPSGGYGWANLAAIERRRRKREEEELADALEVAMAAEGLVEPDPVVAARHVVREYVKTSAPATRRMQRAVEHAYRAQSDLAWQLAAREIARQEEDDFAVLLAIATLH
jgi:hypothetical protein